MIAALYARKSTEQDVADDAKSVTRQVENARAFAIAKGWTVDDASVYADDAVSGADTKRLRNRQRMIDAATKDAFDVIVMQAQDRFSRSDDGWAELKALAKHVQVWFYSDGQQFTTGTLASNVTGFLKGEFAAEFRRAIAQKTSEAMLRRAKHGHVTGGKVFGYDNVRSNGHVDRVVNVAQASVVRDITNGTRTAKASSKLPMRSTPIKCRRLDRSAVVLPGGNRALYAPF
jgi:DNA invertase Pin-like site-specific DNA recombinase